MERKYRPLKEGEKVYWLTCLNKTTNWYQSEIPTIEGEQIYFPGDITWALAHSKEDSVLPERNRHYVTYKGSDFAKIYGEPLTEEEFKQRFYKKESTKFKKIEWQPGGVVSTECLKECGNFHYAELLAEFILL